MPAQLKTLLEQGPVVTDGAWGTQMQERGLPIGACPDEWNVSQPEKVEAVARAYVEAGSRVVLTNTFGASSFMLERHGLGGRVAEINRAGAEISKRAAGEQASVFASIGPTGKMLMMQECTEDEMQAAFTEQAEALAEGGADAIVVETMSDVAEARLAVLGAKSTGLPVVASFVFDAGEDHDRTMMGISPEDAVAAMTEAGADVIGSNCGQGVEGFIKICRRMRAVTDKPLWMKANAGLPELIDGSPVYKVTPDEFVAHVPALIEAGADFIGGCCGTSPAFIRTVAESLR